MKRFRDLGRDFRHQWSFEGRALEGLGRFTEARERYLKGREEGDGREHWSLRVHLGSVCWELGERDKARLWFHRAIEAFPDDSNPRWWFAEVLARAGRLDEAESVLRSATGCRDGPVDEAHQWLGRVLQSQGRYSEALEPLDRALEMDREFWAPTGIREDVARTLERFPELA